MVKISDSVCVCGKCKAKCEMEWEIEDIYTQERGMGEENQYACQGNAVCTDCGNEIIAGLEFYEYPVGVLNNMGGITYITDSHGTEASEVETPSVHFYDL